MIKPKSLSGWLRKEAKIRDNNSDCFYYDEQITAKIREAADALDAKDAEIELLKEGRKLHDELADHLEHELAAQSALIAQAAAVLEHFAWDTTGVVLLKEGPVEYSRKAREALAAIRAKEHP